MSYHYPMPPRVAGGGPVTRAIRAVEEQDNRSFGERRARLRAELCRIIDDAIGMLDAMDGDADLEPSLGAPEFKPVLGFDRWDAHATHDRENAECEDDDGEVVPFLPPMGLRL